MSLDAVSKFKFVSPGVFVDEIDASFVPKTSDAIGPVVIGRTERGPAMRPVRVESFSEFVELFGNPIPGGLGGDVWRDGNYTAPTYAAYAAQAYLKNGSPVNVVRLLGEQHSDAEAFDGFAGWKAGDGSPNESVGSNAGAFGLFVGNSGSSDIDLHLAAVFYITTGSIRLVGDKFSDGSSVEQAATLISSNAAEKGFKAVIEGAGSIDHVTSSFNFNRASAQYIRKVFNTNSTLTNADLVNSENQKSYWLGETFDRYISDNVSGSDAGDVVGCILAISNPTNWEGHDYLMGAQAPKSGWVISQDLTDNTGSYLPQNMTKLFRFTGIENGEWDQKNVKISIKSIQISTNESDPYGTFTVELRRASDSDASPKVLELYTACNLNPASSNYIAKKIGDTYSTWDDTEKRYRSYGSFLNRSKFVRVEMNSDVDAGVTDARLLPFGFFGPPKFTTVTCVSGSTFVGDNNVLGSGSIPYCDLDVADGASVAGIPTGAITASFVFPSLSLRTSSATAGISSPKKAYWGVDVTRSDNASRFDESYADMVRAKPAEVDSYDAVALTSSYSLVFSLDDLAEVTGSGVNPSTTVMYVSGSRALGTSISALAGADGYEKVLSEEWNRFTMSLFGAFDGLDITEKEPFRNSQWDGITPTEKSNAPYYTVMKAIDACADQEVVEFNVMVAPGITNAGITTHMLEVCEARGDALAIIDLEGGMVPQTENNDDPVDNRGSVTDVVSMLRLRGLNTSYGCTYHPWGQIRDTLGGQYVWVPPSVIALGVMANSERKENLFFAPAGFTRGGLTEGAAGLPVINVREKLSSSERDKLYENNINPIASFPAEGLVVYGQKTLQVTPSALDRINVRRGMIYIKKKISQIAARVLFDQNIAQTWARFTGEAVPFLRGCQSQLGISDFRFQLDETTTTPDLQDRNILYAKVFVKPVRSIEFIAIDFTISNSGASFAD